MMSNLIFLLVGAIFASMYYIIWWGGRKQTIVVVIFSFFINTLMAYIILPPISINYPHLFLFTLSNFIVAIFIGLILSLALEKNIFKIRRELSVSLKSRRVTIKSNNMFSYLVLSVIVCCYCVISFLTTHPILPLHAKNYRNLIKVNVDTFSANMHPIDITQIRVVDQELARTLAEKRLGKELALGSQVVVGEMNIQQVNGRLYWVGPLNHSGFLKWLFNREGTPGYVMVSATDERDVKLIQEVNGKKIFLKYNEGCYLGEKVHRYLYLHGYATRGLTDFTFEVDDDMNPYWVVTIYDTKVGIGGKDATGIVIVDAQTGEIKEYDITNAPKWVDRIQPESFVKAQLDDWGKYVHGFWNWSNRDKLRTTPGMSLVYGDDGQSYWYTGVTSVGNDEATVGFILVNTRTKEAKMYRIIGAVETAAMNSAEGAVQEKKYKATFPILYNVAGVPTYFLTLKDRAGLVKLVAFVSVENYNILGVGSTIKEALRRYRRSLLEKGNAIAPDTTVKRLLVKGKVLRIGKDGGNYYILVRGAEGKLFVCSSNLSPEIVVTQIGDLVRIEYEDGGNEVVDMISFDNLAISLKSKAQQIVEKRAEEVRENNVI